MNLHAFHIKHLWHFYHFHALDLFSFSFGRSPVILHSLSNSPCPPFSPLGAPLFWPIFTLFCRSLCHIFDILSPTAASLLFPFSVYLFPVFIQPWHIVSVFLLSFLPLSKLWLSPNFTSNPIFLAACPHSNTKHCILLHKLTKRKDKHAHTCIDFLISHYNALPIWPPVDGVLTLWKGVADCGMMGEVLSSLQNELFSTFKRVELRSENGNLQETGKCPQWYPSNLWTVKNDSVLMLKKRQLSQNLKNQVSKRFSIKAPPAKSLKIHCYWFCKQLTSLWTNHSKAL